MRKYKLTIVFALTILFCKFTQAQDILYGPTVSYQYQKGSIVKAGGYFIYSFDGDDIIRTDVTANFSWLQNKYATIPELALTYIPGTFVIAPFVRSEITPYTVTPKLGLTIITLFDIDFGYGFPIHDKPDYRAIKGFAASLRFSFPLNYVLNK